MGNFRLCQSGKKFLFIFFLGKLLGKFIKIYAISSILIATSTISLAAKTLILNAS